jgi:hypothetical protein
MIKLRDLLKETPCNECGRDWNHGHDHEASMAGNEIRDAVSNASKIQNLIKDGDNLPGWVSAYITLAADYLHSVAEYLDGEAAEMQQPGPGYGADMYEAKKKPSAGLTQKEKSAVAKKASAGKDIGKKGKGFEKVAKAAEKQYGSKEAGQKVAAAAMWKAQAKKH